MKCKNCGNEFEGKYCPECGTQVEEESVESDNVQMNTESNKKHPKKKWIVLGLLIIIIVTCTAIIGVKLHDNKSEDVERIDWSDVVLAKMIPEPPSSVGNLYENTSEQLSVDLKKVSNKKAAKYIDECKKDGYVVDAVDDGFGYKAYNNLGYKLQVNIYEDYNEMDISLSAPMKFSTIVWPDNKFGKVLPPPKSLNGKIDYETDTSFNVYISDMPKNEYTEYVKQVAEAGFNIDYTKGDDYYYASNSDGYDVSIEYQGMNIIYISITAPYDDNGDDKIVNNSDNTITENSEEETQDSEDSEDSESGLRPEFKEAMDSYESFMDEYIAFMNKYKSDPTNLELIKSYSNYMSKYTECMSAFSKWEDEDLNDEELQYYLEVQSRVNQKLLDAAITY
ncbi:MAG: zinc ribbon domain-containing protein [Lachnospiraceae bacterium]|nr:zinc ribbon domain-containing protein [Lachnospiraceae bacterium]